MAKDNGGSAFPRSGVSSGYGGVKGTENGMTLRDYFAGQALVGILALPGTIRGQSNKSADVCVAEAYIFADAMLAERAK